MGAQHCSSLCSQSEGHGYIAKNVIFTPYAKGALRQTSAPQKERKKVYTKENSGVHLLLMYRTQRCYAEGYYGTNTFCPLTR